MVIRGKQLRHYVNLAFSTYPNLPTLGQKTIIFHDFFERKVPIRALNGVFPSEISFVVMYGVCFFQTLFIPLPHVYQASKKEELLQR